MRIFKTIQKHLKCVGNRILKIINAPITIWFLSVFFLSIGGGYFANYQQCKRDFNDFQEKYSDLQLEMFGRRFGLAVSFAHARKLDDIKNAVAFEGKKNSDSEWKSFSVMERKFQNYNWKISFSPNARKTVGEPEVFSSTKYSKYRPLFSGVYPPNLSDADIPIINELGNLILNAEAEKFEQGKTIALYPKCGLVEVIQYALGDTSVIAEGITVNESLERLRALVEK